MTDVSLPSTIRVQTGSANKVRDVTSLKDACEVLIDWPHARRGPFYQSAREAVEAALNGSLPVEKTAEAFAALCDHAGVLVRQSI